MSSVYDATSDTWFDNGDGGSGVFSLPAYSLGSTSDGGISLGGVYQGVKDFGSGAIDLTKTLANSYFGLKSASLGIQQQQNTLDLQAKINSNNQAVAMMQSDWARRMGVQMPVNASDLYGSNNITTTLANMQRSLANSLGGNNTMLYLTIAGIVLAYLQYAKK